MTGYKTTRALANEPLWTKDFFWIFALSLSYFYCLPLLRTGVVLGVTASEIRLYDVVFIFIFFIVILPRFSAILYWWRNLSKAHRYLLYWIIVGFFGLLILGVTRGDKFLIGVIRFIRFFSFSSAFVLMFISITNRRQIQFLYDAILLAIILISILGTLQGVGVLPNFWPDYYSAYWQGAQGYLSTATLAPNHTHYSLVMAIGIIMVFATLKVNFKFSLKYFFFIGGLVPMSYSMIVSQGRSGWLVLGIYIVYSMLFSKGKAVTLLLLFGSVFIIFSYFNTSSGTESNQLSVQEILLYRSINTHKDLGRTSLDFFDEDESEKNYIERVDDNRWLIYQKAVVALIDHPEYWLFGAGFQNASRAIGGVAVAAHNAYINIFAEHGIIGMAIYLAFLYQLVSLALRSARNANSKESHNLSSEFVGLLFGILAVNFFGEIIYPGRALFSFLGTFFVICGLFLHPAWRNKTIVHEH
jgi:O-antigen ligase